MCYQIIYDKFIFCLKLAKVVSFISNRNFISNRLIQILGRKIKKGEGTKGDWAYILDKGKRMNFSEEVSLKQRPYYSILVWKKKSVPYVYICLDDDRTMWIDHHVRMIIAPKDTSTSQPLEHANVSFFRKGIHANVIKLEILRWELHFGFWLSETNIELLAFSSVLF